MLVFITGSAGLAGSSVCRFFHQRGATIHGLDNNERMQFFGPEGDTSWNRDLLLRDLPRYHHHEIDIRDRTRLADLLSELKPDAVVHTAAQPSHDKAASIPFDDFEINALGTLNLLEGMRQVNPEAPFVFFSTNKVYGDGPNRIPLREGEKRWEVTDPAFAGGIAETFPVDQCMHSLFGASKLAADVMVQEYGRYFGIPTTCLRAGCLTGPTHAASELHGFLSYLVRCNLEQREYRVFGYQGKQVRDNLHTDDVASLVWEITQNPPVGEVFNLGGGLANSCSILEAFERVEALTGLGQKWVYVDENRLGDHICYFSDLTKTRETFSEWEIEISLEKTLEEIVQGWTTKLHVG